MSNLILPGQAGVIARPPTQLEDVQAFGPFRVGMTIPLYGFVLAVTRLAVGNGTELKIVLEPVGVTAAARKRMDGKKGKKAKRGQK